MYTIQKLDGRIVRSPVLPKAYSICQQTGMVYEAAMTTVRKPNRSHTGYGSKRA
jgi:hypothetical protein